ncbi:MAG: bifunctional diguanylate cyclase/phosphodiesterase [Azospirillaceae bacterium]
MAPTSEPPPLAATAGGSGSSGSPPQRDDPQRPAGTGDRPDTDSGATPVRAASHQPTRDEGSDAPFDGPDGPAAFLAAVEACVDYAFQPIVNARSGATFGFEALLRGFDAMGLPSIFSVLDTADRLGVLHRTDIILREKAIAAFVERTGVARAAGGGGGLRLFFNLDARVLASPDYRPHLTAQLLSRHGLLSTSVCFELPESQSVEDGWRIRSMLDRYRVQSYMLAIDDFGTGFSGLKLLYDQQPDLVKLDRFFVSGIDADHKKRMFVASIVQLARVLGIMVVAEGVETERELAVCREIGCDLVQGYLIARPTLDPDGLHARYDAVAEAARRARRRGTGDQHLIREQIDPVPSLRVTATMDEVFEIFRLNKAQNFFPIVDDEDRPLGIVHEQDLKDFTYSQYGRDLLSNRSVGRRLAHFLSRCPQCEVDTPIEQVLTTYSLNENPAGILIVEDTRYAGVLSAASLLRILNEKNLAQARDQNPLTKLPGNTGITEWVAEARENEAEGHILAYFDLDNFKPFNDTFGFRQGDRVLLRFAELMRTHLEPLGLFVGHVGGDDFFAGARTANVDTVRAAVMEMLETFRRDVESFYDAESRERGHITARDRDGRQRRFALMTCSAALVRLPADAPRGDDEAIGRSIARAKRAAKRDPAGLVVETVEDGS